MDSKTWLAQNGMTARGLDFYTFLDKVAFRHCDGVVPNFGAGAPLEMAPRQNKAAMTRQHRAHGNNTSNSKYECLIDQGVGDGHALHGRVQSYQIANFFSISNAMRGDKNDELMTLSYFD